MLLAGVTGCRRAKPEPSHVERALLERRIAELSRLVERGAQGPIVPFDQAVVAIDQNLLQRLIDAALPCQTVVGGNYRIRILTGLVTCDDGLALVRLSGRASFADRPEEDGFVEATVYGTIEEFQVRTGETLRGKVALIAVDVRRVTTMGADHEAVKGLLHDLTRMPLAAFRNLEYTFDVPVRVLDQVVLPAFDSGGRVRVPEARLPLHAAVTHVTPVRGRIWISIRFGDRRLASATANPDSVR